MEIRENTVVFDLDEYKEMENYMDRLKETVSVLKNEKLVQQLILSEKNIIKGDFLSEKDFFN